MKGNRPGGVGDMIVPVGVPFVLRVGQTAGLADGSLVIQMKRTTKTWVQNEELGYQYTARIVLTADGRPQTFTFEWYDRTEGEDEEETIHFAGQRIVVRAVRETACHLTVQA